MPHLFSGEKPWFTAKRFGYGAGLPTAWQGWALLLAYLLAMVGLGLLAERTHGAALAGIVILMALLTALLLFIVKARTKGGWHWRWGQDDRPGL